jgi:hypothetical protein
MPFGALGAVSYGTSVQAEQARPAASFLDSLGINTHVNYLDTAYGRFAEIVRPRLVELGIRHIRDGSLPDVPLYYDRLRELGNLGIRSTLIATPGFISPEQAVAVARRLGRAQEALEGPNEFDINRDPAQWVPVVRDYQQQLFQRARADSATRNLPVLGPSFVSPEASSQVGNLAPWCTHGNMHPYTHPRPPGGPAVLADLALRRRPFHALPMMATESGFPTGSPASDRSVSPQAQARYLPRMFLEYFNLGIVRTFAYELLDQRAEPANSEANFGILRSDGTPKPAFVALKNMIAVLREPTTAPTRPAVAFDYRLGSLPDYVHRTLLRKRDGRLYLILWQEVPSYFPELNRNHPPAPQFVDLTLRTPIRQAVLHHPVRSATPVATYTNPKRIRLSVTDAPLILEMPPAAPGRTRR